MKKIVYIIAGFAILSACTSKPGYQISGTIDGLTRGDVVLLEQRIDKEYVQIDSVASPDGTFEFTDSVEIPDVYYVSVPGKRGKAGDEEKAKKLEVEINAVYDKVEEFQQAYLDENPASYIAPYIVQNLHYGKEADEIDALLAKLAPSLQGSSLVRNITRRMETLKKVAIGIPAPEFTQNDSMGNPVSLSSFKGKYLLIDFWAAWCGPCRGENPNVVSAYQKYHDSGFEVLGVSLDDGRENWLKAVKDDGLTWTQVSDLKYWSNKIAALYGISSIPSNLLLDREGVIIKKNLRGEDLHSALEELLP